MNKDIIFYNRIRINGETQLDYLVKRTGITDTPVALVLTCYRLHSEGYKECSQKDSGALYFDRWGRIIDRAPMSPETSARRLQDLYADPIRKDLSRQVLSNSLPAWENVYHLIAGFFQGEAGIARIQYFPDMTVVHSEI